MTAIAIIAQGAASAFGEGADAIGPFAVGDVPSSRVERDPELEAAGLARPYVARSRLSIPSGVDRATALVEHALSSCASELDTVLPGWRASRVGAAIGTSSGGMRAFEQVLPRSSVTVSELVSAMYVGPVVDAARPVAFEPSTLVLGACASSTLAIGIGRGWLESDRCDVVLAGGFDAVSVFVAAGFESLRATCSDGRPRPFRVGRDGLALGEGAAIVALVRSLDPHRFPKVYGYVRGFGASCDASHLTAPDARGGGLARAARAAIEDAGRPPIDLVSAHGTATVQNDAAEAAAITEVLGERASSVPVHSIKGAVGHTLGAAGALEVVTVAAALRAGVAPASVGSGDVAFGLAVHEQVGASSARTALKLSSAFGGANAALVVGVDPSFGPPRRRPRTDVFVSRAVAVEAGDAELAVLTARIAYGADRIARADLLVRLTMAATAKLEDLVGPSGNLGGAGIVVGHGLATMETNGAFQEKIAAGGARRAEPRRFAYTTPNAAAGECAVAFGLLGPAFAVGGGPHGGLEAISVAADLVRARVADRIVVVAVDEVGDVTRRLVPGASGTLDDVAKMTSGAVALLVSSEPSAGGARLESASVRFDQDRRVRHDPCSFSAHQPLLGLTTARPERVGVDVPWGGFAAMTLVWL